MRLYEINTFVVAFTAFTKKLFRSIPNINKTFLLNPRRRSVRILGVFVTQAANRLRERF